MTLRIITAAVLVLGCVLLVSSCYGTRKTLLFYNRVHHWKIYFVKKSHFSVGTYHHFEVYYKDRQLILPKEITDGRREIREFISAAAVENRSSQFGTVLVIFEGQFANEDDLYYRAFVTLHIRPGPGNDLLVTNPCNGKEVTLTSPSDSIKQ